MDMEKIQLKAKSRDLASQRPDKLRSAGILPAELYGHKLENLHLAVDQGEFERVLRKAGESTIVELLTEDGKSHNVLIHGIQRHYLKHTPTHVDFYEVSMTEKLTAPVTLEFVGESKAVKEQGGVLVKVLTEVHVECLPADLPHNIPVDISVLKEINNVILVKDLPVPSKVTVQESPDDLVVKVQPPRDVVAELDQPVVEDVSAVVGAAETAAEGEAAAEDQQKEPKAKDDKELKAKKEDKK